MSGWESRLSWVLKTAGGYDNRPSIDAKNIGEYVLKTGAGADFVQVDAVPQQASKGLRVEAGAGNDQITVGSLAEGLALVAAEVRVTGGDGLDSLVVDDRANPAQGKYRVTADRIVPAGKPAVTNLDPVFRKLRTATGDSSVRVLANPTLAAGDPADRDNLTVEAGPGTDRVELAADDDTLDAIQGRVALVGGDNPGGSRDALVLTDAGAGGENIYTVRADSVTVGRLSALTLSYSGFERFDLDAGPAADTVRLDGVAKTVRFHLDAGLGTATDKLEVAAGEVANPVLTGFDRIDLSGGTLTLNQQTLLAEYRQSGGVLAGGGTVSARDYLKWTGGSMRGTGRTRAEHDARLDIEGDHLALMGRTLVNEGYGVWTRGIIHGTAGTLINYRYLYPAGYGTPGGVQMDGTYVEAGSLAVDLGAAGQPSDAVSASKVVLTGGVYFTTPAGVLADRYLIVSNTGPGAVQGTFAGLAEGASVWLTAADKYTVSYAGGTGNDVVLTRVPLPPPPPPPEDPVATSYDFLVVYSEQVNTDGYVVPYTIRASWDGVDVGDSGDVVEVLGVGSSYPASLSVGENAAFDFSLWSEDYWSFTSVEFTYQIHRGSRVSQPARVRLDSGGPGRGRSLHLTRRRA